MKRPVATPMLDLSTGHLSLATRSLLDLGRTSEFPEIAIREAGFFLSSVEEPRGSLPADLSFLKRFARENGFAYLLFDSDADPVPGLPWYGDRDLPDLGPGGLMARAFLAHLRPHLVGGREISAIDHAGIPEGALALPAPESSLSDGDYVLEEGSAWFTVGAASVRIHASEEGVRVAIHPLGSESEPAVSEAGITWDALAGRIETPGLS